MRIFAALSLLAALPAAAAPPPGASSCAGCHGGGGMPGLAGQPAEAIATAMLAYKAGEGSPTVMDRIARGFTEAEIRAIAAWVAVAR
jgi:cytochrome subunit of sulfide dehydrogenase